MEWSDDAIVLAARPHGESAAVAWILTRDHGRHAGLVQGARSARQRGLLEPGNRVSVRWRARLSEHLGTLSIEVLRGYAASVLDDPLRLAGLASAVAVVDAALPEREPHPAIFEALATLFDVLDGPAWAESYVRWEIGLLQELGFGLDLDRCAATGGNDDLAFVSPRSGRAVSLSAGQPYRDRLLPLPGFLVGRGGGGPAETLAGLDLTGYFLDRHVFGVQAAGPPAARRRFVDRYRKQASPSDSVPGS